MKVKITINTPDIGKKFYYSDVENMLEADGIAERQMMELVEEYVDERGGDFDRIYDGYFDYEIEKIPNEE